MNSKALNYAAHWLRFENYLIPYPLIKMQDDNLLGLTSFVEELPSTIFIDGVICLRYNNINRTEDIDRSQCQIVSIDALNKLLNHSYEGLEVIFPN